MLITTSLHGLQINSEQIDDNHLTNSHTATQLFEMWPFLLDWLP